MNKVKVFCDSCSSITKEQALKLGVDVIPVTFTLEGKDYVPTKDDIISYEDFYEKLENKVFCKTTSINPSTFIEAFTPYLKDGYDIVFISLSSGLTASYNNFNTAKGILADDFNNQLYAIDPRSGSLGNMFSIVEACRMRDEGKSALEIYEALSPNKLNVESLFTIGSLDHLRRGGRLSKLSAVVGTILHINPIIRASEEGKLQEDKKHRGRRKALNDLVERAMNNAMENTTIYIAYTNCKPEADEMKATIESKTNFKVEMGYIDYTMGSHCGPRTIAVFYRRK